MKCLRVLIVDGDPKFLAEAAETLAREKYSVTAVSDFDEAAAHIRKVKGKSIILSELTVGDKSGLAFLKDTLSKFPDLPFTFLATSPPLESVIEALKRGAYDFLRKPVDPGILCHSVARSVEKLNLSLESERVEKGSGERLSKMQAEIKQIKMLAELKNFMISMAAHDFKSVFTVLDGYYRALAEHCPDCVNQHAAAHLEHIGRSIRKLRAMADTLLDYEAARRGELNIGIKPFDLCQVLKDSVAFYKPIAEQKQIRLVLENEHPGLKVKGDPDRVMQILDNLLYNAIKFTPRDGRISVGAKPGEGRFATAWVSDTGKGIPKSQAEKIFSEERIVSGGDAIARIGLGLNICRKLLDIQDGKIWLESEQGKGTKVFFSLPV
jgi:signal transduction histidine kinase